MARQAEAYDRLYDNRQLGRRHDLLPDDLLNFHHDPLACVVAVGWDGVRIEKLGLHLDYEGGYLIERPDPSGRPFRVVTAVETRFSEIWLDVVSNPRSPFSPK